MAGDNGLNISQFAELGKEPAVETGRAWRFAVMTSDGLHAGIQRLLEFTKRNMEERQGRSMMQPLTVLPVPFNLAVTDIVIAMDIFLSFQNDGIH